MLGDKGPGKGCVARCFKARVRKTGLDLFDQRADADDPWRSPITISGGVTSFEGDETASCGIEWTSINTLYPWRNFAALTGAAMRRDRGANMCADDPWPLASGFYRDRWGGRLQRRGDHAKSR